MESSSLFENSPEHEPLAARMRPRSLDEYIGQDHIVGKGRLLRRAIAADQLTSVMFYGPPGSGKTTLARVIASHTKSNFITLNAVLTGVADIRKAIADAEQQMQMYTRKTILFFDEVHRWNKSQQDALLPWVENGTIILIGATTENPFFEVNKALVSRSRVFQLKALTKDDLLKAAHQALGDAERGYGHWNVSFEDGALEHLVDTANGDARSLLNALELAVETTPEKWSPLSNPPVPAWGSTIFISRETAEESIQKKVVLYDRDGDYHYDIISAFIKSLRGRDPDAACYWLARMIKAGEDPHFIFRRMMISACEDTGLAAPEAISIVESCAAAFDRVGLPEGRYFLAHAALYLATAPKSNSSMAFFDALASVEKEDADVPNHLRDASRDAEGFGHGKGYLYPHAYRDHWVAQQYLPDSLVGRVFYTPSDQGYESKIREEVFSRREVQLATILGEKSVPDSEVEWWNNPHFRGLEKTEENLTFSPEDPKKNSVLDKAERSWINRLESNKAALLTQIRDEQVALSHVLRHHRCLVWNADDALLLFHLMRKTPEGLCAGVCRTEQGLGVLEQYSMNLGQTDKPLFAVSARQKDSLAYDAVLQTLASFGDVHFDRLFFRDIFAYEKDIGAFASMLRQLTLGVQSDKRDVAFDENYVPEKDTVPFVAKNAVTVVSQRIPSGAQHLAALLPHDSDRESLALFEEMERAESEFFSDKDNPLFAWDEESVAEEFKKCGFGVSTKLVTLTEKRRIGEKEINLWFTPQASSYASFLAKRMGEDSLLKVKKLMLEACKKTLFDWHTRNAFFVLSLQGTEIL